ncbi:hypothetical protein CKO12_11630 [Chromatium okenii]|uniref:cytochrome c n=1 Tax=Chromatium okenii TaxID=61644 RepID=UPI0019070567|nr:cytochrome c [Chromatium okenii]MBK1642517.1 hypothetical protein [Chromatium okenii]
MNLRLLALLLVLSKFANAADDVTTRYQTSCTTCHGTDVYTSTKRRITSFDALERQVNRCTLALSLRWSNNEVHDVSAYLNQRFYHFPR